jgi:SAM-dependent methyltransferase
MASKDRWQKAQEAERGFWQRTADNVAGNNKPGLSWYDWRAKNLQDLVSKALGESRADFAGSSALEIGSGPVGLVAFLDARERYAIDPLCDFYSSQPHLIEFRNPQVTYTPSRGESLEFDDSYFDLVAMENVIDHVEKADVVMQEINRVLKPDGVFFFTVNLHPGWGAFLHEIISAVGLDQPHPHTFSLTKVRQFVDRHGFEIKLEKWEDYREMRRQDFKSNRTKDKLKAISGLSEFLYTAVLTKK